MEQIINNLWQWVSDELTDFVNFLDFYYGMAMMAYMAGINYTKQLDWYKSLVSKCKLEKGRDWIAALILLIVFCIFRGLGENKFNSDYVASLLMTGLITIICGLFLLRFLKKKAKDDKGKEG